MFAGGHDVSDVFLSYQSDHRGFAGLLAACLEAEGFKVWWSGLMLGGTAYEREIWKRLSNCKCVVVLWSQSSIDSDWVRSEAEHARGRGCLIPVKIDDVAIWPPFTALHTIDLRNWSGDRKSPAWKEVIVSVGQHAPRLARDSDEYIRHLGHHIHKLTAKDNTGRQAYYFVLVEPARESDFLRAIDSKTGIIDLEDFGRVVASCYGDTPSAEMKEFLKQRYGFIV